MSRAQVIALPTVYSTAGTSALPPVRAPGSGCGRPGDRGERWEVNDPQRADLRRAACCCGLAVNIAAALLVEMGLVSRVLPAGGHDALDRLALAARPRHVMSDESVAYVRTLLSADRREYDVDASWEVVLPARLTDRLLRVGGPQALFGGDVYRARDWEVASAFDGLTMTEWAFRGLLTFPTG